MIESAQSGPVIIFGAGTGAKVATRYLIDDTDFEVVGYVVDGDYLDSRTIDSRPVVPVEEMVKEFPPGKVRGFVPLGAARMNAFRAEKAAVMKSAGYDLISYVHSSARAGAAFTLGENCFVLAHQTINYDVVIGSNVVIWSGCHLGDRCRIQDDVFLAANVVVNGDATVGERSYVASNATISHGIRVGRACFIGANALISSDTKDEAVHVCQPTPALPISSQKFVRLLTHQL